MTNQDSGRYVTRVGGTLLMAMLIINAASFWDGALRAVWTPYELDYGEGIVLYQAATIDNPQIAYKKDPGYPYIVYHYPPIYHVVTRTAAALLGADLLVAGRLVSVTAGFLTQLVIVLLVFNALPRALPASARGATALAAGLLITLLPALKWTSYARVDMLGVLFSFTGLAIFIVRGPRSTWAYVSFALFVAALFTKQTFVAAPAACVLATLLVDWRRAARFSLFVALLGAGVLGTLVWTTHGGLLTHLLMYNANPFSLVRMIYEPATNLRPIVPIVALALGYGIPLAIAAGGLIAGRRWNRLAVTVSGSRLRRLGAVVTVMWILAFAVSLSSGKRGSNYNYFLEWNIASCPLAALMVFHTPRRWYQNRQLAVSAILPLLIVCGAMPEALLRVRVSDAERQEELRRAANYTEMVRLIQQAPGPVFSEDMVLLIKAGRDVPAEPAILTELSLSGKWDEGPFLHMIEQHRFSMIVIENDLGNRQRFTPAVSSAIAKSYAPTHTYGTYKVYEPPAN